MIDESNPPMSLLWHDGTPQAPQLADGYIKQDLNLRRLVRSMSLSPQYEKHTETILLAMTSDEDTIRYRQAILDDLLNNPALVDALNDILNEIITLEGYLTAPQWKKENVLRQVAWRLSELERYVDTVIALHEVLQNATHDVQSDGLRQLRQTLSDIVNSALFVQLRDELPKLIPEIRATRSITVGINLDSEMRPISATLLDTHQEPIMRQSMMSRIFGFGEPDGILVDTPVHNARKLSGVPPERVELRDRQSPFMPALFKDLSELLDETSQPIVQALRQYTAINSQFLVALKLDIAFYLGAVTMIQRVRAAGQPMTRPQVMPKSARVSQLDGLYNLNLALQNLARKDGIEHIVGNDAHMNDDGRIFILTGPNQGGKTTYTQAIGVAQLLFQAGLHVPATSAQLSPVDAIYTHFAADERPDLEAGRLGEEARRLNTIFQQATRYSLVLLNESLASTAATESLYIARDVVRAFRLLGVRAVFATHLHDLAADCDDMNRDTEGDSAIISMVSQVQLTTNGNGQEVTRTYKIIPSPPMSKSYAIELAAKYGISYEQITDTLKKRDVL